MMKRYSLQVYAVIVFSALLLVIGACCNGGKADLQTQQSEPPYEAVIENLTLGQDMPDLGAVEAAVNAIIIPELNCKIRILNIPIWEQKTALRLMKAQNQQIDLVNTGRQDPLEEMVNDSLLLPLDDLLKEHGNALLQANRQLIEACRVNGSIYMVPAIPLVNSSSGFYYNAEMAREYGITISEYTSPDDLELIAPRLKEHGKYLLYPNMEINSPLFSILYPDIVPVSASPCYGVISREGEQTKVVNPYESDEYLDYCLRIRKWVEKGWIPDQFITSGLNASSGFLQGTIFMSGSNLSPLEFSLQSKNYPFRLGDYLTRESAITTDVVRRNGWGISSSSANPRKAMELLNFIYENSEVANLLMNGLEGREYRKISEHIVDFPEGQSSSDLKYTRSFTMYGDYTRIYEWKPLTEDDYKRLQKYYQTAPLLSPLFGYSFDITPVSAEIAAVTEVLEDYLPALECGLTPDVRTAVSLFNEKLEAAGINRIISENQRQLDAWLNQYSS